MTDEEINRAIGAECGDDKLVGLRKRGLWYRPNAKGYTSIGRDAGRYTLEEAKKHEYLHGDADEQVHIVHLPVTNYCGDLNAMHKAEQMIPPCHEQYAATLSEILELNEEGELSFWDMWKIASATSRQRAEAFLKVKGKWNES